MIVPPDRFECHICKGRPFYLTCEACHETMCSPCSEIVWVVRDEKDWAHILCKDCANVEP